MDKITVVKVLGVMATIFGCGVSLLSDWVDEQKMDAKIEEKINAALTEKEDEDEEGES